MGTDIDSFIHAVEGLDEARLEHEIDGLRERQAEVNMELTKRLDALEVKRRWKQQQPPSEALGARRDVTERLQPQLPSGGGPPAAANGASPPRGREAVRAVMEQGGVWNARAVFEELERRGLTSDAQHPYKAVETAMSRLYNDGALARVGRGQYRYRTEAERAEP